MSYILGVTEAAGGSSGSDKPRPDHPSPPGIFIEYQIFKNFKSPFKQCILISILSVNHSNPLIPFSGKNKSTDKKRRDARNNATSGGIQPSKKRLHSFQPFKIFITQIKQGRIFSYILFQV